MGHFPLQSLPDELLGLVFDSLSYTELCNLTLANRWAYSRAVGLIWKKLDLVDEDSSRSVPFEPLFVHDQHDETRILKKLFVLATNPYVASKVQTVIHRCHLPTPELFEELPNLRHDDRISFSRDAFGGMQHRSTYVRLVLQAVANMVNVQTLKIILGHSGLTQALVWGFFGPHREAAVPVRRLWLESCCVSSPLYSSIWAPLDFSQVESLRLRRLWFQFLPHLVYQPVDGPPDPEGYRYDRSNLGGTESRSVALRNSTANHYLAYIRTNEDEEGVPLAALSRSAELLGASSFDEILLSHAPSISFLQFVRSLATQRWRSRRTPQLHDQPSREALARHLQFAYSIKAFDSVLRLSTLGASHGQSPGHRCPVPHHQVLRVCRGRADFIFEVTEEALWPRGCYESILTSNGFQVHDRRHFGMPLKTNVPLLQHLYLCESSSLTSLNFDWVIFQADTPSVGPNGHIFNQEAHVLARLCKLHFPRLRSFQMRNFISTVTEFGNDVFLFQTSRHPNRKSFLDFLEAHSNLECLAWPMSRFFPPEGLTKGTADRVRLVVTNLGRTLTDLRVDTLLTGAGEPVTDDIAGASRFEERVARRLFITEFAPHMKRLTSIKMEGGIPRDEKRETARALRHCPLEKLVFIGASFPPMNTWGEGGEFLAKVDDGFSGLMAVLPEENDEVLASSTSWDLVSVNADAPFYPQFGREQEPLLYTIACHFAGTIRQLKFCGYLGSPILQSPSPSTHPALNHLKHFHALHELVMSFWLLTFFDEGPRDEAIIKYWLDMRSPQSTALAVIPSPAATLVIDDEVNPVHEAAADPPLLAPDAERWLYDNYHPANLAQQIKDFIGPYLSPLAKAHGVRVRASFCLGNTVQDIFDFDVLIGIDNRGEDEVLGYVGPREDSWESGRSAEKLEDRRWF